MFFCFNPRLFISLEEEIDSSMPKIQAKFQIKIFLIIKVFNITLLLDCAVNFKIKFNLLAFTDPLKITEQGILEHILTWIQIVAQAFLSFVTLIK